MPGMQLSALLVVQPCMEIHLNPSRLMLERFTAADHVHHYNHEKEKRNEVEEKV